MFDDFTCACVGVAYLLKGVPHIAFHDTMPFGASANVEAWYDIGELLQDLSRNIVRIPVSRYVDDYFAAERKELMQHAMVCFARLVRAVLGQGAISERKLEYGNSLVILGMLVEPCVAGVTFRLCPTRAKKWAQQLRDAIDSGYLDAGSAQKLAGRLTWATQWLFNKVGRAMIRPIYAQHCSGTGTVSARLLSALKWWLEVLEHGVTEVRPWRLSRSNICRLYVDAASTPACCAAVLCIDGKKLYTSWEPSVEQMRQFKKRRDKQIMTLEILAILGALHTFQDILSHRKVAIYSDNKGAEHSTIKGSAKAFDHNLLA